jgi:hypothetical protein
LYFAAMVARLILGLTMLSDLRWFASPIPTVFHLVLATSLPLYGHFHYVHGARTQTDRADMAWRLSARLFPYLPYPVVVTTTFAFFALLRSQGVSLVVSTYVPVLLAGGNGDGARSHPGHRMGSLKRSASSSAARHPRVQRQLHKARLAIEPGQQHHAMLSEDLY